jgi:hypothetical protein
VVGHEILQISSLPGCAKRETSQEGIDLQVNVQSFVGPAAAGLPEPLTFIDTDLHAAWVRLGIFVSVGTDLVSDFNTGEYWNLQLACIRAFSVQDDSS